MMTMLLAALAAAVTVAETVDITGSNLSDNRTVTYVDAGGQERSIDNFSVITAETGPLSSGWYLAEGTLSRGSLKVEPGHTVNLILADDAQLTVRGGENEAGVAVPGDAVLNIYAQSQGTGQLQAWGGKNGAGLGTSGNAKNYTQWTHDHKFSGTITIYGGIVKATGGTEAAGIGGGRFDNAGTVTINGGEVTAQGGEAGAGIGGGFHSCGKVIINGGKVYATGGKNGTGIGGGAEAEQLSEVEITGGEVTAKGDKDGAGIGGDSSANVATKWRCKVTIAGGKVTATGGSSGGAGIGGAAGSDGAVVMISGGEVTATGEGGGAGIGGGYGQEGISVTITGGKVTATGGVPAVRASAVAVMAPVPTS